MVMLLLVWLWMLLLLLLLLRMLRVLKPCFTWRLSHLFFTILII
jgi:hypothetical protein